MITRFGMSDRFGLMGLATVESEYLGGGARLTCSDRTAADVDTEVMNLLKQCYDEAKEMLAGNRELMDKLAAHLIEKETISGKEFMKIYREEKGLPDPEEKKEQEQTAEKFYRNHGGGKDRACSRTGPAAGAGTGRRTERNAEGRGATGKRDTEFCRTAGTKDCTESGRATGTESGVSPETANIYSR